MSRAIVLSLTYRLIGHVKNRPNSLFDFTECGYMDQCLLAIRCECRPCSSRASVSLPSILKFVSKDRSRQALVLRGDRTEHGTSGFATSKLFAYCLTGNINRYCQIGFPYPIHFSGPSISHTNLPLQSHMTRFMWARDLLRCLSGGVLCLDSTAGMDWNVMAPGVTQM